MSTRTLHLMDEVSFLEMIKRNLNGKKRYMISEQLASELLPSNMPIEYNTVDMMVKLFNDFHITDISFSFGSGVFTFVNEKYKENEEMLLKDFVEATQLLKEIKKIEATVQNYLDSIKEKMENDKVRTFDADSVEAAFRDIKSKVVNLRENIRTATELDEKFNTDAVDITDYSLLKNFNEQVEKFADEKYLKLEWIQFINKWPRHEEWTKLTKS